MALKDKKITPKRFFYVTVAGYLNGEDDIKFFSFTIQTEKYPSISFILQQSEKNIAPMQNATLISLFEVPAKEFNHFIGK